MLLHIDMDAFYASVEERDHPELVGQPLIVGGTPQGRGVVAAANYVVRQFGVHSAMPTSRALRLCPAAIVLPPRMQHYAEVSGQIHQIFHEFTPLVEPLSLDEAFLDVTGSERLFGSTIDIGRQIKRRIREELGLVASVGVAPNKFIAKIASDLEKPDAFVVVREHEIQQFLDPLPVKRLWGVGRATETAFQRLGLSTIGDVRRTSREVLLQHFGQTGVHLWELAHGIDHRAVVPDREAKSVSHETTFPVDLADPETLRAWVLELADQVGRRLRRNDLRGRTVQLKVRFADFRTITRARTLAALTCESKEIGRSALLLLEQVLAGQPQPIRLLGVGLANLESGTPNSPEPPAARGLVQRSLFDEPPEPEPEPGVRSEVEPESVGKQSRLESVTDEIREKFGSSSLVRGSSQLHGAEHRAQPRLHRDQEETPE